MMYQKITADYHTIHNELTKKKKKQILSLTHTHTRKFALFGLGKCYAVISH